MTLQRIVAAALATILSGCFNDSAYTPLLSGLGAGGRDAQVPTGSTSISVSGESFMPSIVVYWNGQPLATTYKDGSHVQATLDPALTDNPGSAQITATNEDSFPSKPLTIQIVQTRANVSALSPPQASVGAAALALSVKGTGFLSDSQVLWNDSALQTTFVNAGNVTAVLPASLLAAAGDGFVQVSNPTCSANSFCKGVSPVVVFTVGTSTRVALPTGGADLAWDSTHARLYSSPKGRFFGDPSSIVSIDPATGGASIVKTTTVTALQLSVSAQDRFLYTGGPAAGPPMRYTLPGFTDAMALSTNVVTEIVAAPAAPSTAALLFTNGTGVIDDTALRANVSPLVMNHAVWGFDASTLYASSSGRLWKAAVDQSGVTFPATPLAVLPFSDDEVYYDRVTRRLYGTAGANVDEQGQGHGTFAIPRLNSPCPVAPDGANGKVFFACLEDAGVSIRSYDAETSAPIARVLLAATDPFLLGGISKPTRIARWGANGLAVATAQTLYLYSGAFVR
jgi:hypothetical protein